MDNNSFELSSRYYPAEITVWVLGTILVLYRLLGLKPDQPLPFININLKDSTYFPHIVSATLLIVLMYLFLEFKLSQKKAKEHFLTYGRFAITTCWAVIALWLSIPKLVANTLYKSVSPAWYLGFLSIGFLLGFFAQILTFSSLMIRDPNEAKTLKLPRIPNATRAQYIAWGPVLFLLLASYFFLLSFAPAPIVNIAPLLTALAFLYMVLSEVVFLFMYRDNNGNRVPYKERITRFKEIHSFHDRSYDLIDHGRKAATDFGISSSDSSRVIQNKLRNGVKSNRQSFRFKIQQLEEIQIQIYPKDGNPENLALDNCGFKIHKSQGNKDTIRVLFKPDIPDQKEIEISIPISDVVKHAERYVATEPEKTEPDHLEILSNAINKTVLEILQKEAGSPLQRASMAGDLDAVRELIRQGHDVNARGEGGWTALLSSSAQGYPKLMKFLLDSGANPDISNVLGITPLIYGARYGNIEVVKMLIDYGAGLNLQDTYGNTALMKATECGNIKIVDILIEAGADISVTNLNKKNALNIAYELGQGKIAKKLRNADNKRYHDRA